VAIGRTIPPARLDRGQRSCMDFDPALCVCRKCLPL